MRDRRFQYLLALTCARFGHAFVSGDFLIIDEAHNLADQISSFYEISVDCFARRGRAADRPGAKLLSRERSEWKEGFTKLFENSGLATNTDHERVAISAVRDSMTNNQSSAGSAQIVGNGL